MAKCEDLETMIEALTLAISIHEREEAFFRRSALASSCQEAKVLFLEIAEEMNSHLISLEKKKQELVKELANLQTADGKKV